MISTQNLQILPVQFLEKFRRELPVDLEKSFPGEKKIDYPANPFDFYTSISVVFSSKIEGENIELDSFLKHKFQKVRFQPDYTKKTDDLFKAYQFAQNQVLTFKNLLKAHSVLTKNLLTAGSRGKIRKHIELIVDKEGRIEYVAAPPEIVEIEVRKLMADVKFLLSENLAWDEVFYFAALIHLVFLKIHPMEDGNGRAARLLEKWFLAEKLGKNAWFIPSERFYHSNLIEYYRAVHIGFEYENVDYSKCLRLADLLVQSLSN